MLSLVCAIVCDNVHMISSQRQHLILSRLRTRGAVRITALSKELGVSAMTVRRDIAELADKGLLKRVHGGAVTTSTLLSEPLFSVKSQMDIGLKDAIAQEAVNYVSPGDVIAIGGGTTAYVFAQHLLESQQSSGITILTNSYPVAELVQALESKDVEVILTGGVITSLSLFANFDQVDTVITDDGLDHDSVTKTRELVKELVLAKQGESDESVRSPRRIHPNENGVVAEHVGAHAAAGGPGYPDSVDDEYDLPADREPRGRQTKAGRTTGTPRPVGK